MSPQPRKPLDPIELKRQKLAAQLLKKRMREAAAAQERLEEAMEMSRSVDVHDLDLTEEDLEVDDADLYDLDLDALDLDDDESFDGAPVPEKERLRDPEASAPFTPLDEASYGPDDFGRSHFLGEASNPASAPADDDALAEASKLLAGWLEKCPARGAEARAIQRAAGELIVALEGVKGDPDAARLAAIVAGASAALGCLLADRPSS